MMLKKKQKGIITKVAHGWDEIEAPIVAFAAGRLTYLMQGLHGNSKTTVGKLLGYIFYEGDDKPSSFRYYDCSKSNIITMAGFLDTERMKKGEQAFIPNDKSLIGSEKSPVRVILLDEVTRTPKDSANELLEVIENKKVFGIPTGHELLIGTANPDSYRGAMKLDSALLDRFVACLPIPDFKEVSADDVKAMVEINIKMERNPDYLKEVGLELKAQVEEVRKKYLELLNDDSVCSRITAYEAQLVSRCKNKWGTGDDAPYLSGREVANQFWRAILALAAYELVVNKRDERVAFVEAARAAIKYCWVTKHGMEDNFSRTVETFHNDSKFLLMATGKGKAGKVQTAFGESTTPAAKIHFWEKNLDDAAKYCDAGMLTEMMESTLTAIDTYAPTTAEAKKTRDADVLSMSARLYGISKKNAAFQTTADKLEGSLLCSLIAGMNAAGVSLNNDPFKTALSKEAIASDDLVDLLVHLTSTGDVKTDSKKNLF